MMQDNQESKRRKSLAGIFFTTGDDFHMDGLPTYIHERGELYSDQNALVFSSKTIHLKIQGVKGLSLSPMGSRRAAFTLTSAAILFLLAIGSLYRSAWLLAAIFFLFALIALAQWRTKWVQIQYLDENNHLNQVYLSDSSFLGLGSLFGGNKRILRALESQLLKISRIHIHS